KRGQRDAEKIKHGNRSVGKREACGSHCFITPWTRRNSFAAMHDATTAAESSKKFYILHNRHIWKTPCIHERCSPAKDSVVATSHAEQEARVRRKAVGQSVHSRRSRKTNPKETATDVRIAHDAGNFIQRFQRHFGVCMQKPENITACGRGSGIHLFRTA